MQSRSQPDWEPLGWAGSQSQEQQPPSQGCPTSVPDAAGWVAGASTEDLHQPGQLDEDSLRRVPEQPWRLHALLNFWEHPNTLFCDFNNFGKSNFDMYPLGSNVHTKQLLKIEWNCVSLSLKHRIKCLPNFNALAFFFGKLWICVQVILNFLCVAYIYIYMYECMYMYVNSRQKVKEHLQKLELFQNGYTDLAKILTKVRFDIQHHAHKISRHFDFVFKVY